MVTLHQWLKDSMRQSNNPPHKFRITANDKIRAKEVRVIARDQDSVVMSTANALHNARNQGLDLILINEKANPPLCRIVEMNKYLYEQKQKEYW